MFTCSDAAQQEMIEEIQTVGLDSLVVASCAPSLHMHIFRGMAKRSRLMLESLAVYTIGQSLGHGDHISLLGTRCARTGKI
jgi:heterodisulfide reductase subunit A-like polyferredoxin